MSRKVAVTAVVATITLSALAAPVAITMIAAASPVETNAAGKKKRTGKLRTGAAIPAEFADLIAKHGTTCPALTPATLAAQIKAESNWDTTATSRVGARGIAQFMPATWAAYGIDGDGDGTADILNPADAIASAAKYDCAVAEMVASVPGDKTANMLAAYNAGPGAVRRHGGVPPYAETRGYITKITKVAAELGESFEPDPEPEPVLAERPMSGGEHPVIAAARTKLGLPYVYGGGGYPKGAYGIGRDGRGPGFDCSGLVQWAVGVATGGEVVLPRTAAMQSSSGISIPGSEDDMSQMRPGDIVTFTKSGARGAHHVAIYIGGGRIMHAPSTGKNLREDSISNYAGERWNVRRVA